MKENEELRLSFEGKTEQEIRADLEKLRELRSKATVALRQRSKERKEKSVRKERMTFSLESEAGEQE